MYYTNAKTYSGFPMPINHGKVTSSSSSHNPKRLHHHHSNNIHHNSNNNFPQDIQPKHYTSSFGHQKNKFKGKNQEWNKFLFKHYLNIKKVQPKCKKQKGLDIRQLSPQKAEQIQARVQAIIAKNQRKMLANNARNKMNSSGSQCQYYKNLGSQSYNHNNNLLQQKTLSKIQQDINFISKKQFNSGKKQFFVFGLGDATKQSNNNNNNQIISIKTKLDRYRDFLFKINFSNGLYIKAKQEIQKPYKFYIGPGNNGALVRGILRRRYWWQVIDSRQKDFLINCSNQNCPQFIWSQLRINQYMNFLTNKNKSFSQTLSSKIGSSFRNRQCRSIKKRIIQSSKSKQEMKSQMDSEKNHHNHNQYHKNQDDIQNQQRQFQFPQKQRIKNRTLSHDQQFQQDQGCLASGSQKGNIYDQSLCMFSHFQSSQDKQMIQNNSKILQGNDLQLFKYYLSKHKKTQQKLNQAIYVKRFSTMIKKKPMTFVEDSSTHIKIHNHFQCNFYLGNKKALFYYMSRYYKAIGVNPFDKLPLTFHLSKGTQDPSFANFMEEYDKLNNFKISNENKDRNFKNIWIVKPGQYTNRGKGITVCSTLDQIKIRLKGKQKNPVNNQPRTFIIQKYIQRPLLYNKRKFDIRHYMLMTCFNGQYKGYWYAEGYLRTTSYQYNVKNTKDLYTHLTNDAVQKCSSDYGKFQKGNKLSYQQFQKYMEERMRPQCHSSVGSKKKNRSKNLKKQQKQKDSHNETCGYNFFTDTLPIMKSIAADAMRATYDSLSPNRKGQTFQLFGLDFMLDQDLKVYLIQVNTNPCLQTSCPLLLKIISSLIQNVFKITVDPFFPPPLQWLSSKKFQMGDNSLQQNKFQLIFDENIQGQSLSRLLNGYQVGNIGDVAQQDDQYQDQGNQWNQQV